MKTTVQKQSAGAKTTTISPKQRTDKGMEQKAAGT